MSLNLSPAVRIRKANVINLSLNSVQFLVSFVGTDTQSTLGAKDGLSYIGLSSRLSL